MARNSSRITRLFQNSWAGLRDSFRIGDWHLSGFSLLRKYFSSKDLKEIKSAVTDSEKSHRGEIRIAIETKLSLYQVLFGKTAKERSVEMFSFLRVWDTEENTGILVYLLLSEKKILILADRGIYKKIGQDRLNEISHKIGTGLKSGKAKEAIVEGIRELSSDLKKHFPAKGKNPNELPDEPFIV
ncbi:hypothetical protein EHQ53_04960 [Leptospira langatensis]|uniref:TPM domain-containing protein n=1 Tax=Leptospira langatensis TaxID=2484983 RepID=A0A5F1ZYI3_9LEPT|nr:TPM domain-containing protein [Leptospira langatensis]TGK00164.1 hypothetical protein EHO57_12815 [Leptospira langatensis]TGL42800.1 hypothetical protein EHQ53_04960 [Leptospira langatensis]